MLMLRLLTFMIVNMVSLGTLVRTSALLVAFKWSNGRHLGGRRGCM